MMCIFNMFRWAPPPALHGYTSSAATTFEKWDSHLLEIPAAKNAVFKSCMLCSWSRCLESVTQVYMGTNWVNRCTWLAGCAWCCCLMFLLLYCLFIMRYDYQADDCGVMVAVQQYQSCWWWCCHGTAWQQHLMTLSVRGQSSQQETHHVLVT